jgi:DNA-binding NarL/FixJ family response regulator
MAGGRSLGVAAIDPIPIFRDGLSSLIHRTYGLRWVGHAASHYAALQLCEQLKPDVVVLDSCSWWPRDWRIRGSRKSCSCPSKPSGRTSRHPAQAFRA